MSQQYGGQQPTGQQYGASQHGAQQPAGQYGGQPAGQPYGGQPYQGNQGSGGGSRVLGSIVSVVLALVLTPVGIGVFAYGIDRMRRETVQTFSDTVEAAGAAATVVGTVVLLVVALLAGWRPAGPFVAGVVWGAVPATVALVVPLTVLRWLGDLPGPDSFVSALQTFEISGGFALVAAALLGSALAAATARRRGRAAGRREPR